MIDAAADAAGGAAANAPGAVGGLVDDFESAVGTFQEQASTLEMPFADQLDSPGIIPESVADSLAAGEDLFGESIAVSGDPAVADFIEPPPVEEFLPNDFQDDLDEFGEDPAFVAALTASLEESGAQVVEGMGLDVPDDVSDFADDPVEAVNDVADEFEGTVSGIADDIGL
ncbi:MAG: hypothetical protein ABMA25_14150 [Ilumatobacteraceae bacterium]